MSARTLIGDGLALGDDLWSAPSTPSRPRSRPLGGTRPDLAFVFVSGGEPQESAPRWRTPPTWSARATASAAPRTASSPRAAGSRASAASACGWPACRRSTCAPSTSRCCAPARTSRCSACPTGATPTSSPCCSPTRGRSRSTASSGTRTRPWPGCRIVGGLASGADRRRCARASSSTGGCTTEAPSASSSAATCRCTRSSRRVADPIGRPMTVTRSDGETILELAGPRRR